MQLFAISYVLVLVAVGFINYKDIYFWYARILVNSVNSIFILVQLVMVERIEVCSRIKKEGSFAAGCRDYVADT